MYRNDVAPNSPNRLRGGVSLRGPKGTIDAVVNRWPALGGSYTYFFSGRWYATFDRSTRRVGQDSYREIRALGMPDEFCEGITAALNDCSAEGQLKTYFFKGDRYLVYDWKTTTAGSVLPVSELGLPGEFLAGFDTAINGRLSHLGKAYFIKNDRFVRFDWAKKRVDDAPKGLEALWSNYDPWRAMLQGMNQQGPSGVSRMRIDAAEDVGDMGTLLASSHFKSSTADGTSHFSIQASWERGQLIPQEKYDEVRLSYPGILEVLEVAKASTTVAEWSESAIRELSRSTFGPKTWAALAKHFKVTPENATIYVSSIIGNYRALLDALERLPFILRFATVEEARQIVVKSTDETTGVTTVSTFENAPMWASFHGTVTVNQGTPVTNFLGYGPLSRASMVLHEMLHFVDHLSLRAENHHYEHHPKYPSQTVFQATHNASSYSSFAQYVHYGEDTMYGAGDRRLL